VDSLEGIPFYTLNPKEPSAFFACDAMRPVSHIFLLVISVKHTKRSFPACDFSFGPWLVSLPSRPTR